MLEAITSLDQFEAEFRKGIGVEIDLSGQRFLTEVTRDNILNFADAVGDSNPLWINEDYARKSRFGSLTAPPTFVFNVNHGTQPAHSGTISNPIKELIQLYSGAELESFRPIWPGDKISVKAKSTGIVRKQSKAVGTILFMTGEAYFFNQRKEALGTIRTTICRYKVPDKQSIQIDHEVKQSGFQLKSPDILAFDRPRRGSEIRYWEDTNEGQEMAPVMERGVLTMSEISRFGFLVSPMPRRIEARREVVDLGFERESMQKKAGLENASDYGPQRICWMGQFVTDWMGDDGTLKKFSGQVRHPNIIGDSSFIKGQVVKKYINDGEHLVDCEIRVENQSGLITAPGTATVALVSRLGN
jgi:acyl dehydratase